MHDYYFIHFYYSLILVFCFSCLFMKVPAKLCNKKIKNLSKILGFYYFIVAHWNSHIFFSEMVTI